MRNIKRYFVPVYNDSGFETYRVPRGAQFLAVTYEELPNEGMSMWYSVDDEELHEQEHHYHLMRNREDVSEDWTYLGSGYARAVKATVHVFEEEVVDIPDYAE